MVNLETFLNKVMEKEAKKVKITSVDIEGIGEVEFHRPKESQLIRYTNEIPRCYLGDIKEKEEISLDKLDMEGMSLNASELIYDSCSFFRAKELRDMYKDVEFIKLPLIILGTTETIRVANIINEAFNGIKITQNTDEEIKN